MDRIPDEPISHAAFRMAMRQALAALYKRKAEVDDLIRSLETNSSSRRHSVQHKHKIFAERVAEWRCTGEGCRQNNHA